MSNFLSKDLSRLSPYVPGEQPKHKNLIKLNTNENPFGPSPNVIQAIMAKANEELRRYPDPESSALRQTIAEHLNTHVLNSRAIEASNIFIGNGSDEVLGHAFQAFFKQDFPICYADITYGFYPVYCKLFDIQASIQPVSSELAIDLSIYPQPNGGVVLANPNATTGHALSLLEIEAFLNKNTDSVVLVDEAYVDFGAESAVSLVTKYPQLLVVQTLSKSRSLAGMRVGFAVGSSELIAALSLVKDSFNSYPLDKLAECAAIAAFQDHDYFTRKIDLIISNRKRLVQNLNDRGFKVVPSSANFILTWHESLSGLELFEHLRSHHVLVRYFNKPRIDQCLRITIGTEDECQALLNVIDTHTYFL